MKHLFVLFSVFLSLIISLFNFNFVNAGITINNPLNRPFGGKILATPIPGVVCAGLGQTVVLSSNIQSATSAVKGAINSSNGLDRATSIASGIYGMIPTYTTNPLKRPTIGGYILGLNKGIPNLTTCTIDGFPFPVIKTTDTYGVSSMMKPKINKVWTDIVDPNKLMPMNNTKK